MHMFTCCSLHGVATYIMMYAADISSSTCAGLMHITQCTPAPAIDRCRVPALQTFSQALATAKEHLARSLLK
jgi:hypothetical protein